MRFSLCRCYSAPRRDPVATHRQYPSINRYTDFPRLMSGADLYFLDSTVITIHGFSMSLDIDWDTALVSVNGDRGLLKLVISAFIEESVQLQGQISTAIENDDAELLHRCGHTLRGTMDSLGAANWSHTALRLEELGASGATAGAQPIADELNCHLPSLLEQLRRFSAEQSD